MLQDHFREALEQLDMPLLRKIWAHAMPHLPQSLTDDEALVVAHMTRTSTRSIRFRHRAYSHAWLVERRLPSQLPDRLRSKAERMYPMIVDGVGIAVANSTPVSLAIRRSMEEAVLDAGTKDAALTTRAIQSARAKARRQLLGIE